MEARKARVCLKQASSRESGTEKFLKGLFLRWSSMAGWVGCRSWRCILGIGVGSRGRFTNRLGRADA